MMRAALERTLMERRQQIDVKKHWPDACDCTPGRWRKRRPIGCPNGRNCGVCRGYEPSPDRRSVLERELRRHGWPEL